MYVNSTILVKQIGEALKPESYNEPRLHQSNKNKTYKRTILQNLECVYNEVTRDCFLKANHSSWHIATRGNTRCPESLLCNVSFIP